MDDIENIVRAWLRLTKEHVKLFFLELKLARYSIVPLLICLMFLFIAVLGLWMVFMGTIFFLGVHLGLNYLLSAFLTLVLNVVVIFIISYFVYRYVENFKFRHTRKQIAAFRATAIKETKNYESIEKN